MQNSMTAPGQPIFYVFVSPFASTTSSFTALFTPTSTPHPQFYRNPANEAMPKESQEYKIKLFDQEDHEVLMEDRPLAGPKAMRQKKDIPQNQEYNPKAGKSKGGAKKVYEKDKLRNILPNALSKLFFFLKSTGKSKSLLNKILQTNQKLGKYITPSIYYAYHKFMKQKMERFLTTDSLKFLFSVNDKQCINFSLQQQLSIIKINAIMMRNFLKNNLYLQILLNSPRSPKNKIRAYINKYRIIEDQARKIMQDSKNLYDFTLIEK